MHLQNFVQRPPSKGTRIGWFDFDTQLINFNITPVRSFSSSLSEDCGLHEQLFGELE